MKTKGALDTHLRKSEGRERVVYPHPAIVFASVRKRLKTGEMRRFLRVWFVSSVRKRMKRKGLAVDSLQFAERKKRKEIFPWR